MGLSTAERNRRKRDRKKKERADIAAVAPPDVPLLPDDDDDDNVEIEYVPEDVMAPNDAAAMETAQRFQARLVLATEPTPVVSSDEQNDNDNNDNDDDNDTAHLPTSKRKLRDLLRPTVAELKRRVVRPDLVEAHDVAAPDAEFLISLKSVPGTVPVPRHWGRKRKYLQGKRGFEKPPFRLPQFILDTGIAALRDSVMTVQAEQSAKQKNRARVTPKLGAIDVDYRTLHEAFFKHQTKPTNLTRIGDVYYEGKELEVGIKNMRPGQPLSKGLLEALGMEHAVTSPPPWLWNMQRYGPPPSWSGLSIPGLNAPLPDASCQYGYHATGWGQPPVDTYGRPLYGGNPLDPPGSGHLASQSDTLVTSHGKTIFKDAVWGALPVGAYDKDNAAADDDDESSNGEMEESSEEEREEEEAAPDDAPPETNLVTDAMLPPPTAPLVELRKLGMETPKTLYKVLDATAANTLGNEVFASQHQYKVGAESVLSKVGGTTTGGGNNTTDKGNDNDDEEDEEEGIGKNFKF